MKFYKCVSKSKILLRWVIFLLSLAGLFVFSQECKDGAIDGIFMCLSVLIPSLFPFFVLSSFLSESNILSPLSPIFNPLARFLLKACGICLIPCIMAVAGGYPVGAKSVASLRANGLIDQKEAEKLSCVCVGAGPGFLVTFIGVSILNSKQAGIILLVSQIISMVVLCFISALFFGKTECENLCKIKKEVCICEAVVNSVNSAVKSTVGMCGFVVVFSIVCKILTEGFGINGALGKALISALEITTGLSLTGAGLSVEAISALTGFGGICVHLQIFRELKNVEFSKLRFYIFRFVQSAVCFVSTKILLLLFPVTVDVFSSVTQAPKLSLYSSIFGTIALLITSVIFIISIRHKRIS